VYFLDACPIGYVGGEEKKEEEEGERRRRRRRRREGEGEGGEEKEKEKEKEEEEEEEMAGPLPEIHGRPAVTSMMRHHAGHHHQAMSPH
jgi:hypothetical protein